MSSVLKVTSSEHFQQLLSKDLERVSLIYFWATWAAASKDMNEVVKELADKYPRMLVLEVEAEEQQDITDSFEIEAVPTFLILRGHNLLDRISGADATKLRNSIAKHIVAGPPPSAPLSQTSLKPAPPPAPASVPAPEPVPPKPKAEETEEELRGRLVGLVNQSKIVLFMKGSPDIPRCGFSRQIVKLLQEQHVEFKHFDVLTDETVRQGLKKVTDWPTFPQLIVKGELVGGLDVVKELVESGEFQEVVA